MKNDLLWLGLKEDRTRDFSQDSTKPFQLLDGLFDICRMMRL
jgi:hypothetical protein